MPSRLRSSSVWHGAVLLETALNAPSAATVSAVFAAIRSNFEASIVGLLSRDPAQCDIFARDKSRPGAMWTLFESCLYGGLTVVVLGLTYFVLMENVSKQDRLLERKRRSGAAS